MNWIKFADKKPSRRQECDFLFTADELGNVWMLCSAIPLEADDFEGPLYWREAQPLPPGCEPK